MKSEIALFSLVNALTPHEIRYLKLHLERQQPGKHNHLKALFQAILDNAAQDENQLRAGLHGTALGRQYAVYKNLLYHALLRGLQAYRYAHSPSMELRCGLDKVEILAEKGQHAAALKMLHRTRSHAEDYSLHTYLYEILVWERRLLRYLHPSRYLEFLPNLEAQERKIMRLLEQEATATAVYDHLFGLAQVERRMEKSSFSTPLTELGRQLEALGNELLPTFSTYSLYLNAGALLAQLQGDFEGMMHRYAQLLQHWDAHPRIKVSEPGRYARVQVAWLNSLLASGNIATHLSDIRNLRKMPIQGSADRARIVFQSFHLELLWVLDQPDLKVGAKLLTAFDARLPEMSAYLDPPRLASFYQNVAFLYFQAGDYHQTVAWTDRIEVERQSEKSNHYYRNAALLAMVAYGEVGQIAQFESLQRALQRRLRHKDGDWSFGQLVVERVRQIFKFQGLPEMVRLKHAFWEELHQLSLGDKPKPVVLPLLLKWAEKT
jgi:hypothetical protein